MACVREKKIAVSECSPALFFERHCLRNDVNSNVQNANYCLCLFRAIKWHTQNLPCVFCNIRLHHCNTLKVNYFLGDTFTMALWTCPTLDTPLPTSPKRGISIAQATNSNTLRTDMPVKRATTPPDARRIGEKCVIHVKLQ